jgi:hypothetical protein
MESEESRAEMTNRNRYYAKPEVSVAILNRLFAKLDCSLARYVSYARPWARRPYLLLGALARTLNHDHEAFAAGVARLIGARRGTVRSCVFPMDFTSYNDVSLDYLAPKLLENQRSLIATAKECAEQLAHDPDARRFIKTIVSSSRQHAALLAELIAPLRVAPPSGHTNGEHRTTKRTPRSRSQSNVARLWPVHKHRRDNRLRAGSRTGLSRSISNDIANPRKHSVSNDVFNTDRERTNCNEIRATD